MSRTSHVAPACLAAALLAAPGAARATEVAVCTDLGRIVIELDDERAPLHARNFLSYVDSGHYMGTVFHRVIADFMIQGGGFDRELRQQPTGAGTQNESRNGLSNTRGTVAAARTTDPHSAAAQFFINLIDNTRLDGSATEWGYTVFGRVSEGMDVVDEIAALPTHGLGPFATDVPEPLVAISSIARLDAAAAESLGRPDGSAMLREMSMAAFEAGDHEEAIEHLNRYHAICAPVDAAMLLVEAESAAAADRADYARNVLEEYFSTTDPADTGYEAALDLLGRVAPGTPPAAPIRFGNCIAPVPPEVPDGTREDLDGMMRGQSAVQSFMRKSNNYLECLDEIIDDDDVVVGTRQAAIAEYNRVVDITQALGDRFNEQVRAFRARQ